MAFGSFVRNMHRWAAHLLVLTVFLHMIRVFYHGAYKPPREFNWVIGILLLFFTLALSFSGYLLPWDQIAFWAITVGTQMATYFPVVSQETTFMLLGGRISDPNSSSSTRSGLIIAAETTMNGAFVARAPLMDHPRGDFLADARRAGDHHPASGRGHPLQRGADRVDRDRGAVELVVLARPAGAGSHFRGAAGRFRWRGRRGEAGARPRTASR